ncbi:MAG TPA: hypothetical protein VHY31_04660 [Streptosporangiaceae bacterium]|nr:hypothetical protein [Streptosporangiaceae bacterium]
MVVHDDWLLGVIAVQQVQLFLYQLFAESNKPMPPSGPKQWSHKLTGYQRRVLEGLPVAAPDQRSVTAAREAALAVFFRSRRSHGGAASPGPRRSKRASGPTSTVRGSRCRRPAPPPPPRVWLGSPDRWPAS